MYVDVWGTLGTTEMEREETLVELVDRMERAVLRLERIVHGDAELGVAGLNERVSRLERTVDGLVVRQPAPFWWAVGFGMFVMAFGFLLDDFRSMMNLPIHVGVGISLMLLATSGVFFFAGFGWLRKWLR